MATSISISPYFRYFIYLSRLRFWQMAGPWCWSWIRGMVNHLQMKHWDWVIWYGLIDLIRGNVFSKPWWGEHWGNVLSKTTVKSLTCKLAMLQASVWLTIQRLPRTKMRWVLWLHYRMEDMFSSFVMPAKHDVSLTWWGRISSAKITSAIGKPYLVQTSTCCDLANGFSRDGLGLWFDKGHPFASKLIGFDLKVFV